jgi:hypothetical protein
MIPSRWVSQSSFFSTPGTTGVGERMPCRVAFYFTTSLPSWVAGPPFGMFEPPSMVDKVMRHLL